MHQPIQWHEWGEEAFAAAQRENKPILLDIGAVWCHWCHVMDRESYEIREVAAIVNNEHFIAVKVDRDERPDIDSRYQMAVSAVSGQGGWPLTAFLTPDGKPFYGGTYFPPSDRLWPPQLQARAAGHRRCLSRKTWRRDGVRPKMRARCASRRQSRSPVAAASFRRASSAAMVAIGAAACSTRSMAASAALPSFRIPRRSICCIDWYVAHTRDERVAQRVVTTTLEKMAQGGVYDQLAGGFHRYSVDERWIVPHFEKMCYDNSELLKNYVHAYQATGSEFFASVAQRHHSLDG